MAGCCHCFRTCYLTLITLVTLGCLVALFTAAIIIFNSYHIFDFAPGALGVLVACLFVSICILGLAIYVACGKGGGCSRYFVSLIFLILAAGLAIMAVFGLKWPEKITDLIAKAWDDPYEKRHRTVVVSLEDSFHCCGWNIPRDECLGKGNPTCQQIIHEDFQKYCHPISIALAVLAGLVLLAALLTCCHGPEPRPPHYGPAPAFEIKVSPLPPKYTGK
jgi:hypothetical protein